MIILLSNVGTRDVQIDGLDDLPADIKDPRGSLVPRPAAAYVRQAAVYADLKARIRLPMIEKALHYIAPHDKAQVQIVLFATDQPETTPAHFRRTDTAGYAHLMRDLLFARYQQAGLTKKRIVIQTTADNPADYDMMHDFYREVLPKIAERLAPDDQVYLLVAGGTQQMNTMLLFVGSDLFGARAAPVYVSPDNERAATLDIMRQIYRRALCRNLHVLLAAYAYVPAHDLVEQQPGTLEPQQEALLRAMLTYAEARRNLDLERAMVAFDQTMRETRALRGEIQALQQAVTATSDHAKLQETIYLAQIAVETGNWADLLARLHRFSEGCMQLIAEDLEVAWGDNKTRASFKSSWWEQHRAMLHELGLVTATPPADPKEENIARQVDRAKLRTIIQRLSETRQRQDYLAALADLEVVDAPVSLRNNIVHRFTPISQEEVEKKAKCDVATLIARMQSAYRHAFGTAVPEEHAYLAVNRLCRRILEGEQ